MWYVYLGVLLFVALMGVNRKDFQRLDEAKKLVVRSLFLAVFWPLVVILGILQIVMWIQDRVSRTPEGATTNGS